MRISRDCFANFVADFRTTFVRVLHECRENFHVSRTSRELVAKVFNMFKNCMRIFSPKLFRKTDVQRSRDVRASVANLSSRNFGEFTMRNFRDTRTNVLRVSHDGRATVLRQHAKTSRLSGEKIKLSDIRTNVVRHSHECHATVVRITMKISYIRGKVVRHSHECRATVVRQLRDMFSKLDRNSRICRINVYSMRLQYESCVYIVTLCREIFANYSRTSLQLSHSSEIGA